MNLTKPTRRTFLSSMAILSAGAAFGSIPSVLTSGRQKADLQKQWAAFCKLSGGASYNSLTGSDAGNTVEACKGHQYKLGQSIFFSKERIVAIPTWIFWKNDSRKPTDVLITFFEQKDGILEKAITYNRFELEAIYKSYEQLNELSFVKNTTPERIKVKTLIAKNSLKQEIQYLREKEILFKNNFNYNI
ncbi:MAG: hypothetical protein ABI359_02900 [Ginsengibacter sp.]